MAGAGEGHTLAVNNIVASLTPQVRKQGCRAGASDLAVRTDEGRIRYPDALVWCAPGSSDNREIAPILVVEVLSRSSAGIDFVEKVAEYQAHATIRYILVVAPGTVSVPFYERSDQSDLWAHRKLTSLDDVADLPPIEARLSLREIYEDLDPKPYLELV